MVMALPHSVSVLIYGRPPMSARGKRGPSGNAVPPGDLGEPPQKMGNKEKGSRGQWGQESE